MAWTAMVTKGRVMGTKAPTQKNNRQCLETHRMWEEVNTNDSREERLGPGDDGIMGSGGGITNWKQRDHLL